MGDGQLFPMSLGINFVRKEMLLGLAIAWDVRLGHAEAPLDREGRGLMGDLRRGDDSDAFGP